MRQNHYCCVWEIGSDLGGKRSRGGPSLCEIFLKTSTKLFLDVVTKSIFIFIYFYFFLVGPFRFLNHSLSLLPPVLFTVTRSLTELSSETKVSEKFFFTINNVHADDWTGGCCRRVDRMGTIVRATVVVARTLDALDRLLRHQPTCSALQRGINVLQGLQLFIPLLNTWPLTNNAPSVHVHPKFTQPQLLVSCRSLSPLARQSATSTPPLTRLKSLPFWLYVSLFFTQLPVFHSNFFF